MEYTFTVNEDQQGQRIDKCISEYYDSFSRSYIQKLIGKEAVFCNGTCCKANQKVSAGDQIRIIAPASVIPEIAAENIPLDILYEDKDVIVINKPKGMVVHPANGHYSGTLVNALLYHCREDLSGINGILRPGIVHRIDMDTTGSVIACKNDTAHRSIAEQLKDHSINRHYLALVHGEFDVSTGRIDAPIGRSERDRKKMAVNVRNGKPAVTNYSVIRRFRGYTLLDCKLETGRTHQIRVHLASIHHPVVGDPVYCGIKPPCKLQGQALHAHVLGFVHPVSGEYIEIKAPLPAYFEKLLSILPSL